MSVYDAERPRCGDIWMCNIPEKDGSVQSGYRPVFVLSNDKNNTYSTTLNVIPITTKMNKRNLPVHVQLMNYEKYGLRAPSTMMVEQISTVSADRCCKKIGRVEDRETLSAICEAMSIQFPVLIGRRNSHEIN